MSDTKPGELSRQEARKIAEEVAALTQGQTEQEFRIEVLVSLRELQIHVKNLQEKAEEYKAKMSSVTQSIDDNRGVINRILGGLLLLSAVGGLIAGASKVIEMFRGQP